MTKRRERFAPQGMLVLEPKAFGFFFDVPDPPTVEREGDVAIVSIRGPLLHHDCWYADSYDAIGLRVLAALETSPRAVVLSIDSPGGVVSGCFETANEIREICAAAGVPLYAYVDGQATSGAYALACAAEHIVAPPTACIGSIGVISEIVDATGQAAAFGVKVKLVTSGARKGDGHPQQPISEGTVAAVQTQVDELARLFFEHVAAARGMAPEAIAALEAGVMTGSVGVGAGLIDEVASLDQFLAAIAAGEVPAKEEETMGTQVSKKFEDAVATLRKLAEGDDDDAKKAKRMLKAELEDEAPPADEPDGDEPAEDPKKEDATAAAAAEDPKKCEDTAAAALGKQVSAIGAQVAKIEAQQIAVAKAATAAAEASERATLLASRTDWSPELVAVMEKAPIETVRESVKSLPRGLPRKPAAAAMVVGTRGDGQGDGNAARQSPEAASEMARAMGLEHEIHTGIIDAGQVLILGATVPGKKA